MSESVKEEKERGKREREEKKNPPPEEFYKITNDFVSDILITFPEYSPLIGKWWNRKTANPEESRTKETLFVFRHCVKVFPEIFFEILYKNADIFAEDSTVNTEFLPGIVFKQIWSCEISENTRETIWKYLQLILFSVIGTVHDRAELGDAAKIFDSIDETELKNKLQETLEGMKNLFSTGQGTEGARAEQGTEQGTEGAEQGTEQGTGQGYNIPNADELHENITSMMNGKLGKLAMELAEETTNDLDLNMDSAENVNDVFQQLFKNPGKMMNMVKNIGSKIDEKIKSGEIKESELMQEGMELMNKMKNMPGMGDMSQMFSQMGIPGLGKKTKINLNAMENQLNQNMKNAKMKERMRANALKKQASVPMPSVPSVPSVPLSAEKPPISDEELLKIFSKEEKAERSPRGSGPQKAPMPQKAVDGPKPEKKDKKKAKK